MPTPNYTPKDITRFWSKVDKSGGVDSCWNWTAGISKGYGAFKIRGTMRGAHKVAYELTIGEVPRALLVCHTCDNRICCNPSHLFIGTDLDNMRDMISKGRGNQWGYKNKS